MSYGSDTSLGFAILDYKVTKVKEKGMLMVEDGVEQ